MPTIDLSTHPIHLSLGARMVPQPAYTGHDWYAAYSQRAAADGAAGRLVAIHTFTQDWDGWECHPNGDELVFCMSGTMVLIQEIDGQEVRTTLAAGQAAINPAGTWHTADVSDTATALFITAGHGTTGRPR